MSVIETVVAAIRRIGKAMGGLLPEPPSGEAPPPDIDGKRPGAPDPEALRRVDLARKEGKGGYR